MRVAGRTTEALALWRMPDQTLLGLQSLAPEEGLAVDGATFVGILPEGSVVAKFEPSSLEGHYECIVGVNAIRIPSAAVKGKPLPPPEELSGRTTIPERRTPRTSRRAPERERKPKA